MEREKTKKTQKNDIKLPQSSIFLNCGFLYGGMFIAEEFVAKNKGKYVFVIDFKSVKIILVLLLSTLLFLFPNAGAIFTGVLLHGKANTMSYH